MPCDSVTHMKTGIAVMDSSGAHLGRVYLNLIRLNLGFKCIELFGITHPLSPQIQSNNCSPQFSIALRHFQRISQKVIKMISLRPKNFLVNHKWGHKCCPPFSAMNVNHFAMFPLWIIKCVFSKKGGIEFARWIFRGSQDTHLVLITVWMRQAGCYVAVGTYFARC